MSGSLDFFSPVYGSSYYNGPTDGYDPLAGSSGGGSSSNPAYSHQTAVAINQAYLDIFNRPVDQEGYYSSRNDIANSEPFSHLLDLLAHSPESQQNIIREFEQILGRSPSATDLSARETVLANGGRLLDIRTADSEAPEVTQDVQTIFSNELGRAIAPADVAAQENYLAGGGSLS